METVIIILTKSVGLVKKTIVVSTAGGKMVPTKIIYTFTLLVMLSYVMIVEKGSVLELVNTLNV